MYLYLYDLFLQEKKYDGVRARIEARLLDLGIQGRIERLTRLKSLREMIDDGVKAGAKTIVAVGNDQTMSEVIRLSAKHRVTIGYIPVGSHGSIGTYLGIPTDERACDVLSARIIASLDLGKVNGHYFFSDVSVPGSNVTVECDGKYQVTATTPESMVAICNASDLFGSAMSARTTCNPADGRFEAIVSERKKSGFSFFRKVEPRRESVFPVRKTKITAPKNTQIVADGHYVLKSPATVEVAKKKLRLIVGKGRAF